MLGSTSQSEHETAHRQPVEREGELLEEIPAQQLRTDLKPSRHTPTRFSVADKAGLLGNQIVTAVRVSPVLPGTSVDDDFSRPLVAEAG